MKVEIMRVSKNVGADRFSDRWCEFDTVAGPAHTAVVARYLWYPTDNRIKIRRHIVGAGKIADILCIRQGRHAVAQYRT